MNQEKSEYELLREKNIAEINALFGPMMMSCQNICQEFKPVVDPEPVSKPKVRERKINNSFSIVATRKSARLAKIEPVYHYEDLDDFIGLEDRMYTHRKGSKFHRFHSITPRYYTSAPRRHTISSYDFRKPEDITEEELDQIATSSVNKTYSQLGTSCHQCRQKTVDMKTICRSGHCIGVRGQFCGPCLKNRYGESVREALLNPVWACPPCRDLCNCSICRTREGKAPTGILAPIVQQEGFVSVKDFLLNFEFKRNNKQEFNHKHFVNELHKKLNSDILLKYCSDSSTECLSALMATHIIKIWENHINIDLSLSIDMDLLGFSRGMCVFDNSDVPSSPKKKNVCDILDGSTDQLIAFGGKRFLEILINSYLVRIREKENSEPCYDDEDLLGFR